MPALSINSLLIDADCVGSRWAVEDEEHLARLIAIVVMGQAAQAAYIIKELIPASPAFSNDDLRNAEIIKFTVQEVKQIPRVGYPRFQRDGLIFEIISWIAARQVAGNNCFLKDPHVSSTSQGLDGLMIELTEDGSEVFRSTIFEDKCTINPRSTFTQNVIPGFLDRHGNKRSAELIATAASLIKLSGIGDAAAMRMVEKVLDKSTRYYRAGFALTADFDTDDARKKLFSGYDKIEGITAEQRIGASLIIDDQLRDWFDSLATRIVEYIVGLGGEDD